MYKNNHFVTKQRFFPIYRMKYSLSFSLYPLDKSFRLCYNANKNICSFFVPFPLAGALRKNAIHSHTVFFLFIITERMLPLKDWISLFEKYRIDQRLYDLYRHEYAGLPQSSPRKAALEADLDRLEHSFYSAELLLAHYDSIVISPRDALNQAQERLFLACHYIKGLSIESTASAMGLSRDTVYRIRRRIVARGEISKEIINLSSLSASVIAEGRDARQRVQDARAVREACFAGKSDLVAELSSPPIHSRTSHPDFLFFAH